MVLDQVIFNQGPKSKSKDFSEEKTEHITRVVISELNLDDQDPLDRPLFQMSKFKSLRVLELKLKSSKTWNRLVEVLTIIPSHEFLRLNLEIETLKSGQVVQIFNAILNNQVMRKN
jgi:hypothetical protein